MDTTDTLADTKHLINRLKQLSKPVISPQAIDDVAPHNQPLQPSQEDPYDLLVPFDEWEALAYDLALAITDRATIATAYHLTCEQLDTLQSSPHFSKLLQAKIDEVNNLGSGAYFAVKMRMLANRAAPQLLYRLTNSNTSDKDFLAMFKAVTELGQLSQNMRDDKNALVSANVVFNISGVPGLDHLAAPRPEPPPDVSDADWQEVIMPRANKILTDTADGGL